MTFEFLPTLGVVPTLGRAFVAADDRPDSVPTVMLSHGYWQRRFGGAQNALGQDLVVDGVAHRIVGVLPSDFRFLNRAADLLVPMRLDPAISFVGPLGETTTRPHAAGSGTLRQVPQAAMAECWALARRQHR